MFYLEDASSVRPVRVDVTVRDTFLRRLTGALVPGRIPFRRAYLFPGGGSIHTFFMRSSISVLSFDESGRILSYRAKLPPFRIFPAPSRSFGLLEMAPARLRFPGGDPSEYRVRFPTEVTDRLDWPKLSYEGPDRS